MALYDLYIDLGAIGEHQAEVITDHDGAVVSVRVTLGTLKVGIMSMISEIHMGMIEDEIAAIVNDPMAGADERRDMRRAA